MAGLVATLGPDWVLGVHTGAVDDPRQQVTGLLHDRSGSVAPAAACVLGLTEGEAVDLPSCGVETLEFSSFVSLKRRDELRLVLVLFGHIALARTNSCPEALKCVRQITEFVCNNESRNGSGCTNGGSTSTAQILESVDQLDAD
jgi:hypothetical protein